MMAADSRLIAKLATILLLLFQLSQAFYIPGYSIKSYADGDHIPLFVNKVFSDATQISYAYSELPFICAPLGKSRPGTGLISGANIALNLGEVLRGDRIMVSDYELQMGRNDEMHKLCDRKIDKAGMKKAIEVVRDGYVAEWIVDNLPGATSFVTVDKSRKYYAAGFKLGHEELSIAGKSQYYLNNHVTLVFRWRRAPGRDGENGKKVIVGFEVYAKSITADDRDASGLPKSTDDDVEGLELSLHSRTSASGSSSLYPDAEREDEDVELTIPYTYSVYWREDETIEWHNRWDLYFVNQEDGQTIHWLAIINSLVISGFLTAVVAVVIARTVHGEIKGYGEVGMEEGKARRKKAPQKAEGLLAQPDTAADDADSEDELAEDITGWKLVHGDVFRPPPYGHLLAPLVGSGVQLVLMALGLIILSCLGILNPSFRGGFVSVGFALFLLAGLSSGYFSARIFKTFGGAQWRQNAVVTAALFPGLLFATIFLLNLFVWAQASSTAIPLTTLFGLVFLWLGVQVPLVYAGSYYGFERAGSYTHPIKATVIPRQIPPQTWYTRPVQVMLLAGLVPFLVIFIELLYVFRSVWQDKSGYYYVFGFLSLVSLILILAVMETTIIAVYIQLCSENYHWWWQSFLVGGSSSIWIFLYSFYYYARHLHVTGLGSTLLFFAYSFLACLVYGLLTGTIGFLTAYTFIRRIYGAIKVD